MFAIIIIAMSVPEKARHFEYSSLVMGSRDIPSVSFPQKRPILIIQKSFLKKTDYINNKYTKGRSNKIRARNQRPDIFLEGEQLAKTNTAWQRDVDLRYFQNMREKLRKSTPNGLVATQPQKVVVKVVHGQRTTPSCSDFQDEFGLAKTTGCKEARRTTGSLLQTHNNSSNHRVFSTDRQRTAGDRETPGLRDTPGLRRDLKMRIQHKIVQKAQLRREQSEKAVQQFRRKQLFYVTQRDLNSIKSQSFIVVQYPSSQIVTGYYYKKVVEIASLTKIMTFYVVMRLIAQFGVNPDTTIVQIDAKTADMSGTSAELYEGDRFSVRQLLYALMLPSGNDAAAALARWGGELVGEGSKDFVGMMNRLAGEMGMKSSSFGNPHGLPHSQNGSTAEDVSVLVSKCLQFELFRQVVSCRSFRCWTENEGVKREVVWQNTNKLLRRPGFGGVKTGVTTTAGPCLATLYTANGRNFIVVLLRTSKLSRRFKQTRWILGMCLRRMNFDGGLAGAIKQLGREDPQLDSDNSQEEQQFNFYRNDLFELDRRRRILLNEL